MSSSFSVEVATGAAKYCVHCNSVEHTAADSLRLPLAGLEMAGIFKKSPVRLNFSLCMYSQDFPLSDITHHSKQYIRTRQQKFKQIRFRLNPLKDLNLFQINFKQPNWHTHFYSTDQQTPSLIRIKTCLGSCKAPEGRKTKVAS